MPLGPLPPLGDFLDTTGGGIIDVAEEATHPNYQEVIISGLDNDVTIYRDNYGIPHIYAKTDKDMAMAIGYVQAQDRLWQMDIFKRFFSGTLAEVVGSDFLDSDIFFRSIGIVRIAEKMHDAMKTDPVDRIYLELLDAFAQGVNKYISEDHPLPFEFQLVGYQPSDWRSIDTLAFSKYQSFLLAYNELDLVYSKIQEGLGMVDTYELFPRVQPLQIPVIPDYGAIEMPAPYNYTKSNPTNSKISMEFEKSIPQKIIQFERKLSLFISKIVTPFGNLGSEDIGSNNWAIHGNRTVTGKPIVASDPHLSLIIPPIFYQMSQHSEESGINAWGYTFIGTPSIILGHTDFAAWGATVVAGDVTDWYFYEENDAGQYLYDGTYHDYEVVSEEIKVKGSESHSLDIPYTIHGPLISLTESGDPLEGKLALSWVGSKDYEKELNRSSVLKSIFGLVKAKSFEEFQQAIYLWSDPDQNIVYGDVEGNIALWVTGYKVIRPPTVSGRLPLNGSDPDNDWLGLVSPQEWPQSKNPEQGYLASANQGSVGPDYPYFISSFQAEGYRGRAINKFLHDDSQVTIQDSQNFQSSIFDTSAEAFVPFLLDAIQAKPNFNSKPDSWDVAVAELQNWDYLADKEKAAPLIHRFFIDEYKPSTFADEYLSAGIDGERFPQLVVLENFTRNHPDIKWFDNKSTPAVVETRDDILLTALKQALLEIESEYGPDVSEWKWGDWHQASINHILGFSILSAEKRPLDGSRFTLNVANGPDVSHGPSNRAVYDMSNLTNSWSQIPGGQSGNPTSPHYMDILEDNWFPLEYLPMYFFPNPESFPENLKASTLILRRS